MSPSRNKEIGASLRQIAAHLDQFERDQIKLNELVDSLEFETKKIPDEFSSSKDVLEDVWTEMEIIHAMASYEGKTQLAEPEQRKIHDLIAGIRAAISLRG